MLELHIVATQSMQVISFSFKPMVTCLKKVLHYVLPSVADRQGTALNTVKDIQQSNCKILNISSNFHVGFELMLFEFKM